MIMDGSWLSSLEQEIRSVYSKPIYLHVHCTFLRIKVGLDEANVPVKIGALMLIDDHRKSTTILGIKSLHEGVSIPPDISVDKPKRVKFELILKSA